MIRIQQFFFFILVLSLLVPAFGQHSNIAAMEAALPTTEGRQRVDLLNNLSLQLEGAGADRATSYGEEALDLSQKIGYQRGLAVSAYYLGNMEKKAGHFRRAARLVETGVEAAHAFGDPALEIKGVELLIAIYQQDNRQKKLAEVELQRQKLKNRLTLDQQAEELAVLQEEFKSKEEALQHSEAEKVKIQSILNVTLEDKLRQEAELQRLAREKAELELRALQLENEATKNALATSEKEKEILVYDARLKRQQFVQVIMGGAFVLTLLVIGALIWYFNEKRERTKEKLALQRQLMTQDKMATLGQLTAGIAHEINPP